MNDMDIYQSAEDSYLLQKYVRRFATGRVLDMGTGSGIQALTAMEVPSVREVVAADINPKAVEALKKAATETGGIITVEDHFLEGGIGEAVASALFSFPPHLPPHLSSPTSGEELKEGGGVKLISLAVRKMPRSGKPEELLDYEEIDKNAIVKTLKEILNK